MFPIPVPTRPYSVHLKQQPLPSQLEPREYIKLRKSGMGLDPEPGHQSSSLNKKKRRERSSSIDFVNEYPCFQPNL